MSIEETNIHFYIACPWHLIRHLCIATHLPTLVPDVRIGKVYLFECTKRTLGITFNTGYAHARMVNAVSSAYVCRVERFKLTDKKDLDLFDTIYAATRKDKESAEIMLEMLATCKKNNNQ